MQIIYSSFQTDNLITQFLIGRMLFVTPNQQRQSTEGKRHTPLVMGYIINSICSQSLGRYKQQINNTTDETEKIRPETTECTYMKTWLSCVRGHLYV